MSDVSPVYGVSALLIAIFLFVLAICWIVLPFAIIGTKPLLQRLIREAEETNKLLRSLGTDYRMSHPGTFPTQRETATIPLANPAVVGQLADPTLATRLAGMGHNLERDPNGRWMVRYKSGEAMTFPSEAALARLVVDLEAARASQ